MKKILSLILICILLFSCAAPPACAEGAGPFFRGGTAASQSGSAPASGLTVVDVQCWNDLMDRDSEALVVLMSDGTLRRHGMEKYLDSGDLARLDGWRDLRQVLIACGIVLGLHEDGTVSCLPDSAFEGHYREVVRPDTWRDVASLHSLSNDDFYGLTRDGRLLHCYATPGVGFNVRETDTDPWTEWKDVVQLVESEYPDRLSILGVRSDGTVLATGDYFLPPMQDVVEISALSRFYVHFLRKDGTVAATGTITGQPLSYTGKIRNAVQILFNGNQGIYRQDDGRVFEVWEEYDYNGTGRTVPFRRLLWTDVTDIQGGTGVGSLGLGSDGRMRVDKSNPQLEAELSTWRDVVRFKAYDCYVLGWQSDGKLLTAGVDVSWLGL